VNQKVYEAAAITENEVVH